MKQEHLIKRLESIVAPEFDQLKDNTIFRKNGNYHVFEKYVISKSTDGVFTVEKTLYDPRTFSSLRLALSWCIADKYGQMELATMLQHLDKEKDHMSSDVTARESILKKIQDPDRREVIRFKLDTKKASLRLVENRLTKCVNLAKYWQIQGFNSNETARTRRT